jgi:hypothetical protein
MRLLPATQWEKPNALKRILDDDRYINEESSPGNVNESGASKSSLGNTSESGASPFEARKSFRMNLLEHRDERSSDDDDDDEYGRQEIESKSEIVTPLNQDIENIRLDSPGVIECSLETDKTVLQKWETIIRSNRTDTNSENFALSSRTQTRRSLGGLKNCSNTLEPTNVRRSFDDVTNNFSEPTGKGSHSVKKSLLTPPDHIKLEQSSKNITSNRDDRCTSISPFGLRSCQGIKRIGPNQEDRNKFRRVYDTWRQADLMNREIKCNNNYNTVGKSSNVPLPTIISASSPIKEFGNDQQSFSEEESSSSMEILTMNNEEFGNDEQICTEEESSSKDNLNMSTNRNRSNGQDLTSSGGRKLPGNDNVDSVPIKDSDRNGSNRPIGAWDHQREDDTYPSLRISSKGKMMKSSNNVLQDIIIDFEESTKGIISGNVIPLKEGSSPQYILSNKDVCRNDIREPVRALIILKQRNTCDVLVGEAQQNNIGGEDQLIFQNIVVEPENQDLTTQQRAECECTWSAFSGNDDLISFFLPQMGMACACGRQSGGLVNPNNPTAIENILRPWQVEFLKSFDIHRGEQLVKARHWSGGIMARALRQWRKKHDMVPFKTRSCATALQIWSKISKAYVRSIRKQILAGNKSFERESGTLLVGEMSQFLCELPAAPSKRRQLPDIEPDSQVEV